MSIYIGNLPYEVTQSHLRQVFQDCKTGVRGFGFVDMETETEAAAAIEALDGAEWMGWDFVG